MLTHIHTNEIGLFVVVAGVGMSDAGIAWLRELATAARAGTDTCDESEEGITLVTGSPGLVTAAGQGFRFHWLGPSRLMDLGSMVQSADGLVIVGEQRLIAADGPTPRSDLFNAPPPLVPCVTLRTSDADEALVRRWVGRDGRVSRVSDGLAEAFREITRTVAVQWSRQRDLSLATVSGGALKMPHRP